MIPTQDPNVFILEKTDDSITYLNSDGKKWKINGKCICCGMCEEFRGLGIDTQINVTPSKNGDIEWIRILEWSDMPGNENACVELNYENRLDIPMTPEGVKLYKECSLRGEYIDGN